MGGEQRLEFSHRLLMPAEAGIGAAQVPPGIAIVWPTVCLLPEVRDPELIMPAVAIGDLEIGLRDLHLRVQLQRAGKLRDRLVDQTLLVIQNAEVVVRPGVRRIDPLGERAENREIALRQRWGGHRR